MIHPQSIVDEARSWIGVPFQHQGRTRFGVDCLGLIICVRRALGPFPEVEGEPQDYVRQVREGVLLERIQKKFERTEEPEVGGVILMKWATMPHPTHMALFTGENIIHSYAKQKRVLECGYRAQWTRWTHSFWRLPGVRY